MTRRVAFTQAQLHRAAAVADQRGLRVAIIGGAIVLLAKEDLPTLGLPEQGEEGNTCDAVFGVSD